MEDIAPFLVILWLSFIFGLLGYLIWRSRQRLPIEQGLTPIHEETCSGIIGWKRLRGPFVRISVYEAFLVVSYYHQVVFDYQEIVDAELMGHFRTGLELRHRKPNTPTIKLGSNNPSQLREKIMAQKNR